MRESEDRYCEAHAIQYEIIDWDIHRVMRKRDSVDNDGVVSVIFRPSFSFCT